ncbi:uncharacterized protein LOC111336789 isoform X1 [Stylophora pistillata]|uniref:Uncharacterized protein n=1 Tax=Stylophora pistillata TaxID=50429 RepID=A0A2B4RW02_STYPI|nr:uncharacterized protein LOC111336789 isoform X1 [Stylophora pistillata]PFX20517.1 hypothetical protein AWC38_SpisGene15042 [Stylophora pistillata]
MALESTKKKRTNLLTIVDRLVKKTESRKEVAVPKKKEEQLSPLRPAVPISRSYLLPPTPSSDLASPSVSDQESVSDDEQVNDKQSVVEEEKEEIKKGVPKQQPRCDVCGLRAFKSYRFISRTSAPIHLKNFVTPEHDRLRVCKRCFSSKERCRQNLALILLRSKTSQRAHLRTPLGVTYNRATKGMDYIARDLKKRLKRPYEDLLCDETMADEDEMEVEDERFLLSGSGTKNKEGQFPKVILAENGNFKQGVVTPPSPVKSVGIVTVVKHHSGKYNSVPNCFTLYGDVDSLKDVDKASEQVEKQNENNAPVNVTENLGKLVDHNISLPTPLSGSENSEINNINNKLTFLDHAYALPPPKGKMSLSHNTISKPVKSTLPKAAKVESGVKQEPQRKPDGQTTTSERTCGIVCFLCDKLVTKSYSCYKKENAPDKIKHLFTPGVKIIKVCRKCMPYKKPKEADKGTGASKGKVKVVKGKLAKIHSAKLIKNAKTIGKVNSLKGREKPKVTSVEKNSVKSPVKDDKKRKEGTKDEKFKPQPASKKLCTLAVQTKKSPSPKGMMTKEYKIVNVKFVSAVPKGIQAIVKGESKTDGGKSNKGSNVRSKASSALQKSDVQKSDTDLTEKANNNSTAEKESATANKLKSVSVKVDSGTQSMKSMIGINKVKDKESGSLSPSGGVLKDDKDSLISDNVESLEISDVDVSDVPKESETVAENVSADSKVIEDDSTMDTEDISKTSSKEKNRGEMNLKMTDRGREPRVKQSEKEVEKLEDSKLESKSPEELKESKEAKEKSKDSKSILDIIMTRGRRSASLSPVVLRGTGSSEAASSRKGRTSGTPDRKCEDKQIMPTRMTRKRLASFSESEADKKTDETPGGKRRVVAAALLERMSRKTNDTLSSSSTASSKVKQEHTYAKETKDAKEPEKEVKGHSMTRRNQVPVKCAGCNENVVKSYRCVMRTEAPSHIKPLFAQQPEEMLRICRKCVKKKEIGSGKISN